MDKGNCKAVAFVISVSSETDYAKLGKFIYKRENHESLTKEETALVKYRYYFHAQNTDNTGWAKRIHEDEAKYTQIEKPWDIKNLTDDYQVVYYIMLEKVNDIVELQNLYLLMKFHAQKYKSIMLAVYGGKEQDYYKISQYLYSVSSQEGWFRNAFFFVQQNKMKRLALNGIEFSRRFIPLQSIDENSLKRLFKKCGEVITADEMEAVFSRKKQKGKLLQSADLLEGAKKLLYEEREKLGRITAKQFYSIIEKTEVLSFILFSYSISGMEKELKDWKAVRNYIMRMRQYTNAIRQLAENILFHTRAKWGCLSFRIHDSEKAYFRDTYHIENETEGQYLEIVLSDFWGGRDCQNIAEHFVSRMEESALKDSFSELKPVSFFEHTERNGLRNAWKSFYSKEDNIGKHFGLKIFQGIVEEYKGFFIAESHSSYNVKSGETSFSFDRQERTGEGCLPGTKYRIVFPLENVQRAMLEQDFTLDRGIKIGGNIEQILKYKTAPKKMNYPEGVYESQQGKNELIAALTAEYEKVLEEDFDAVYLSLKGVDEETGELLIKALLIILYRIRESRVRKRIAIIFYDCSVELRQNMFESAKSVMTDIGRDLEGMFYGEEIQIKIFSVDYEELALVPNSVRDTNDLNAYIGHMKCVAMSDWYIGEKEQPMSLEAGAEKYIPYDILQEVEAEGESRTLFEHYAYRVLNENIQLPLFGCKLGNTHMRLGSTIHTDKFYEAEILFGNKLFISRFAMLLVKDMYHDIKDIDKLTLYGYGTYSETVLVQMTDMIKILYPNKDVDYIILEREEERRGFLHKDRIRYNRSFTSKEEQKNYFADRSVAVIVLINSTLKTHVRLISLLKDENEIVREDRDWIVKNYAVLLVGPEDKNMYWRLTPEKHIIVKEGKIEPEPQYLLRLQANYYEPLRCDQCFPKEPIAEKPLVEVNAASTIPNQAFGLMRKSGLAKAEMKEEWIKEEEEKLQKLKGSLLYGHVHRNENHFLYYFKTDTLWLQEREAIEGSLKNWKDKYGDELEKQYNIVVAPMHFSNAGFVELVNNTVFDGNATLLRIDFDKEYRENAETKFSYLRNYIGQLCERDENAVIGIHFIDDAIISGRTYRRAASLLETVLDSNAYDTEHKVTIRLFDKIFVLVDRNSAESRMQYIVNCSGEKRTGETQEKYFYSFIDIDISSLRNYGDSCILCNLKKEADLLYDTASTEKIAKYGENYADKFKLYSLEELQERRAEKEEEEQIYREERSFRRLFCTHMTQTVLHRGKHDNDKSNVMYLLLKLMNTDYKNRNKRDKYEYFLSYLKCISRPFLVFKKPVKEAIFDILLLLMDAMVSDEGIEDIIKKVRIKKSYLMDAGLVEQFRLLDDQILKGRRTKKEKRDLVRLLMKQLTEMKSNYIIRPAKMKAIFTFMRKDDEEFRMYYITLIKRLVGVSSDTTKSLWLDEKLLGCNLNGTEMSEMDNTELLQDIPEDFLIGVLLENTRAFRDGIEKLYIKRTQSEVFREFMEKRLQEIEVKHDCQKALESIRLFRENNKAILERYRKESSSESRFSVRVRQQIQNVIEKLPKFTALDCKSISYSLSENGKSWYEILEKVEELITREEKYTENDAVKEKLHQILEEETNVYQYSNFKDVLKMGNCLENDNITEEGIDILLCCIQILVLSKNDMVTEQNLIRKVNQLAILFKVILCANKVQFVVETRESANLSAWKQDAAQKFNEHVVGPYNEKESRAKIPELFLPKQGKYMAITDYEEVDEYIEEKLDMFSDDIKLREKGYLIDNENGKMIWKLENNRRIVWIVIENDRWKKQTGADRKKIAFDVRRVMMFQNELKNEIFNPQNDDLMNELYQTRKQLNIYNSNKIYTHTKEDVENIQYRQALSYIKNVGQDRKCPMEMYPFYVLNLLADLNVSKCYRREVQGTPYQGRYLFSDSVTWSEFAEIFQDGKRFLYREENSGKKIWIELEVGEISEESAVLCEKDEGSIKEMLLLLYSLILNAGEEKRGKRICKAAAGEDKNGVQNDEEYVIVTLEKKGGSLVISNKTEEKPVEAERIRKQLRHIPESEEEGISLWSFNRMLKRKIGAYVSARIDFLENKIKEGNLSEDEIKRERIRIRKLVSDEYDIKIDIKNTGGRGKPREGCFKICLPIFMEAYSFLPNDEGV